MLVNLKPQPSPTAESTNRKQSQQKLIIIIFMKAGFIVGQL